MGLISSWQRNLRGWTDASTEPSRLSLESGLSLVFTPNLVNMVKVLSNLKIPVIPIPLIVFTAVLGALFLFLAVPRIIAHDDPVGDQLIHACVNGKSGEIKIIDPLGDGGSKDKGSEDSDDGCKKKDIRLDWNAVGSQGDTGPQGAQGIQGDTGLQGEQGIQGDTGLQGAQGILGDTGLQGEQGIQGDTGLQGEQGIQGATGPQGDPATDDQTLALAGTLLSITGGNSADLSTLPFGDGNSLDAADGSQTDVLTVDNNGNLSLAGGTFLQTSISPTSAGSISDGSLNTARSVYVSGKYAYVAASEADSLTIVDVSDPSSPAIAGSVSDGGVLLDGARSVYVSGKYAYVAASSADRLTIVDVSDPSAPTIAGSVSSGQLNGAKSVYVSGKYA